MGEMPLFILVKFPVDELRMVVYFCEECYKPFLYPEVLENPVCPKCGKMDHVQMAEEYI